ncbi:hypothetical protein L1987_10634 [Smallanthus sonchifolius]|uniref:Uncharacterized protein n=1 Tax=Smallanthus sonchifolius TaxID=185202 RepID=A0ACB9JSM0_9ASTR|nr:hypothetical protein L1987_10634 [Smallanthus sonchifolius]
MWILFIKEMVSDRLKGLNLKNIPMNEEMIRIWGLQKGAGTAARGSLVCTAGDYNLPNHMRIHDKEIHHHIIYILVYAMGVQSTTNYGKESDNKWTSWVTMIMLTLFLCRWRMEFFKSGLCMRCEACMPLSSTGLGRGVGTQSTLGTTKSSCVCMLFTSIWSNAMGLLGGIGLAQLCLSGRTGRWAGTPCTHYTCDFKSWVRFANLTGIEKGKDGIPSPWDRRKRPQVGKIFREKREWIQRAKRIRNKSRNRNTTGTQNYSTWKLYFWNFSILTWETKKPQYQWWDSDIRHQSTRGKHLPSTRINGIEITKNGAAKEHNLRPTSKFKYHGAKNTPYCLNAFDKPLICSSGYLGEERVPVVVVFTPKSIYSMETANKEKFEESRSMEPPDPGVGGKFCETDDSSDGSGEDEDQNQRPRVMSRKNCTRMGKPSSFLDRTRESALRRYSLRSDAGGSTMESQNQRTKGLKAAKKDQRLHAANRSSWDKENDASKGCGMDPVLNQDICLDMSLVTPINVDLEVEGTNVPMNQEYTGNSILDNLSHYNSHHNDLELEGGEDQEVNSEESNKLKSFCNGSEGEGVRVSLDCMQDFNDVLPTNAWEKWQMHPLQISWPDKWGAPDIVEGDSWGDEKWLSLQLMERGDTCPDHVRDICNLLRPQPDNNDNGSCKNFFDGNNTMLGILHEWGKSLPQTCHKDAIKTVLDPNSGEGVLDITSDPEEEIMHKKRKKKNRKGGGKKSKRKIVEEAGQEDQDMAGNNESKNRKKYKIWSSKNRKPEKNLPMTKHIFRSGDIPRPQHLLGFSEFRVGHEGKTKRGKKEDNSKRSQRRPVGEFYSAAAEIEEKLSATIGNITSKDASSKLVNSVKGMPSCKLSKFSARVNDVGEVCIDENMVEPDPVTVTIAPQNTDNPALSYVKMLTGQSQQPSEERIISPNPVRGSQNKGNGVASNMVDELITGEYRQNLHVHSADNQLDPPTRVKPRKPLISVVETSNRFNLLDEEGNIIEENGENTVEGITDDEGYMAAASESEYLAEHGTNGENNNGTHMEEVESDTDAMASLMKNDNLEIHHVDSDLDMSPLQPGSPKGPTMTLLEDIVVSA